MDRKYVIDVFDHATMFQLGHNFSVMDRNTLSARKNNPIAFQLGHNFSVMDRAAILRPLLMLEKWRFSRG